jgi:integrase
MHAPSRRDPERLYVAHRMALVARLVSSRVLENGEDLAVVSRSLGHADLSTTAEVYAHLTPAILQRSADRMDAILGRRASG